MLWFEFERGLLRFKAKTPALAPLSQLPPRMATRFGSPPKMINGLT